MNKIWAATTVLLLALGITACKNEVERAENMADAGEAARKLPTAESMDDTLKQGINHFSYAFLEELDKEENVFFSPYSISMAFSMLTNGAGGSTENQLKETFGITDLNAYNAQVKQYLEEPQDKKASLSTANSIWYKKDTSWSPNIKDTFFAPIDFYYNGEVFEADFQNDNEQVVKQVNQWVSEKTNAMIDPYTEKISTDTVMALYNAVYFYGEWSTKFMASSTFKKEFYGIDGVTQVDMMHMENKYFRYSEANGIRAIELPYGDGKQDTDGYTTYKTDSITMNILLPTEENADIQSIFLSLDYEEKEELLGSLNDSQAVKIAALALPKFTMDYKVKQMIEILKQMGLQEPFNPETADLNKIGQGLYVSDVSHRAKLEVDEEGSRASAITEIAIAETAIEIEAPVNFFVNRPFIFVIRDSKTGINLFVGSVVSL